MGRRIGQRSKILVVGAYVPPWYTAAQNRNFYSYVNDCLIQLHNNYDRPYVIVAGDFNKRDFKLATCDFPEMKQIQTGPTRGNSVLDVIGTNLNDQILESGVAPPIQNDFQGADADHGVVYTAFRMARVPQYEIESYSYHKITVKAALKKSGCCTQNLKLP